MSGPPVVVIEEGDPVVVDVSIDIADPVVVDIGSVSQLWVQMTAAQYAALAIKDPSTLYLIVG